MFDLPKASLLSRCTREWSYDFENVDLASDTFDYSEVNTCEEVDPEYSKNYMIVDINGVKYVSSKYTCAIIRLIIDTLRPDHVHRVFENINALKPYEKTQFFNFWVPREKYLFSGRYVYYSLLCSVNPFTGIHWEEYPSIDISHSICQHIASKFDTFYDTNGIFVRPVLPDSISTYVKLYKLRSCNKFICTEVYACDRHGRFVDAVPVVGCLPD